MKTRNLIKKIDNKTKSLVRKLMGLEEELYKKLDEIKLNLAILLQLIDAKRTRLSKSSLEDLEIRLVDLIDFFEDHPEGFEKPLDWEKQVLYFSLTGYFGIFKELLSKRKKDWKAVKEHFIKFDCLFAYLMLLYLGKNAGKLLQKSTERRNELKF